MTLFGVASAANCQITEALRVLYEVDFRTWTPAARPSYERKQLIGRDLFADVPRKGQTLEARRLRDRGLELANLWRLELAWRTNGAGGQNRTGCMPFQARSLTLEALS